MYLLYSYTRYGIVSINVKSKYTINLKPRYTINVKPRCTINVKSLSRCYGGLFDYIFFSTTNRGIKYRGLFSVNVNFGPEAFTFIENVPCEVQRYS